MKGCTEHVERVLADWLDLPLRVLGENPIMVAERPTRSPRSAAHRRPTARCGRCGPSTIRAQGHRGLPPGPALAVQLEQQRRSCGDGHRGPADLVPPERRLMRHPIRREFHLISLLSSSRPAPAGSADRAIISKTAFCHIPRPKGGADHAFDIPLSRPMIRCLIRAIRAGAC